MRRIRRGIPGCPDISEHVSAMHRQPFLQAVGLVVKLIDRQTARFAEKKFLNDAVIHGQNRRAARRKDIGRLMSFPAGAALTKSVLNIAGANSANRQGEVPPQESLVIVSEEVRPGRQNRILEWFPGLALAAARVRKVETQISDTQNQR